MLRSFVAGFVAWGAACGAAFGDEPERFSVEVVGEGPPVVLIPGLASSALVWDETVEWMAEGYEVHVIQVAGFAGAAPPEETEEVLAPLIVELGEYVGELDAPVVVGHSMGGLIGLEIAASGEADLRKLVIVDALPFYPLAINPNATAEMMEVQAMMVKVRMETAPDNVFRGDQEMTIGRMVKSPEWREPIIDWSVKSDRSVLATATAELLTRDVRPRVGQIKTEVAVIYPYDEAMGVPAARIAGLYEQGYAEVSRLDLRQIDGAFHFVMYDQPEAFAAVLGELVD